MGVRTGFHHPPHQAGCPHRTHAAPDLFAKIDSVKGLLLSLLAMNFVSPGYDAVIVWLPTLRVEVVNVATPLVKAPVPRVVLPSTKVTVPVGTPSPARRRRPWP